MMRTELERSLTRIADDLLDASEKVRPLGSRPDEAAALLRKAAYIVEDAKAQITRLAVGELVQCAAHKEGIVGPVEYEILRERKLAA